MEVKPINKRASGQAFEVILKPPSPVSDAVHSLPSPPKRDISLEDIQNKLEAAEERRRVRKHEEGKVNAIRVQEWLHKRWVCSSLLLVSGGPCTEGLGGEARAREGGNDESRGGEQQLQQDGRGEAPDEDGSDQGEP